MALMEYKYDDMIHRCFRCGYCKFPTDWGDVTNCPAYARYRMESYSTGGRLWLIRAWVNGELEWSENLAKIIYACTGCKNCEEKCPLSFSSELVNMVVAARTNMVEQGLLPVSVKGFLNNVQLHGNPYGISAKKRGDWTGELKLEAYNGQEYLFYVGCEGSFDSRAQETARTLASLLQKAGISFGILGPLEKSDGNEVEMLGEDGLFELLVENNIHLFNERHVQKIITLSPHSYNSFKNRYPDFGGNYEVFHYTQILHDLIEQGSLQSQRETKSRICFHDPCFLGRWNQEYKAPREVLKSLDGIQLLEMGRNKKGALCCGGGGGNFYTDFLGGSEDSPSRIRVREAVATGANILAVACPNCLTMLEDAVKAEGLEDELVVKDIAEIVHAAT
ncbi:(Fe-S)-binding protein [bacterium]|nr:(Fe-S)-binding protein [bacterium]